ncbi:type II toxin-antitoxin system VapB family antitoxin [Beggiatoa leptomitoformis]|uniref:Uncharacterized protein n=1 Tax=Beggiatoa leptomitoformis TaxID=288004 RepID=A0A2N9YA68_9GAMM|nr:type II toxin-antitoxin system VapB family antitoxin [Beggiatoa leptomitoformis]ALG67221.1 hypothetical protein AL038_05230 [Beggiatoa leptomitoformis]AUI67366.1 hypothetical protein BLE401_00755 [Beggiatoa leptomitoformis]
MQIEVDDDLIQQVIEKSGLAGESAVDIALRLLVENITHNAQQDICYFKRKKLLKEHFILLTKLEKTQLVRNQM